MADTQYHSRDLTQNSNTGGVAIVTIADPAADISPDAQPCLSCLVLQQSGTQAYMNIGTPATAETGWKLSSTMTIPVPITNLDKLHFFGTAGDVVQIVWRGD